MVAMPFLLLLFEPRPPRPRWRSTGRRRSTTHPPAGRSTAEDTAAEIFLPREEWASAQGKKVSASVLRLRRSRRSRSSDRSSHRAGPVVRALNHKTEDDVAMPKDKKIGRDR